MSDEISIRIATDKDLLLAREEGRRLAATLDFAASDLTVIATAISELARNILRYARTGDVTMRCVEKAGVRGLSVVASDEGPGISDISLAMQDGYSTSAGLGLGLPGTRRLVDEFEIRSTVGQGTTVSFLKWVQ